MVNKVEYIVVLRSGYTHMNVWGICLSPFVRPNNGFIPKAYSGVEVKLFFSTMSYKLWHADLQ